jgi:hypothetical protein
MVVVTGGAGGDTTRCHDLVTRSVVACPEQTRFPIGMSFPTRRVLHDLMTFKAFRQAIKLYIPLFSASIIYSAMVEIFLVFLKKLLHEQCSGYHTLL